MANQAYVRLIIDTEKVPVLTVSIGDAEAEAISLDLANDLANTLCILAESGKQIVQDRERMRAKESGVSDG